MRNSLQDGRVEPDVWQAGVPKDVQRARGVAHACNGGVGGMIS